MGDFNCKDINGLNVSQFVFNKDGKVSGIISTGSTTSDPHSNPTTTTYSGASSSFVLPNGTILSPISETCCKALNFFWEPSNNTCYWSETCDYAPDLKITMGAKGNDGAWFQLDENESCHLEVEFDYLFQFDCDTLRTCRDKSGETNCLSVFSGLSVSVTLDKVGTKALTGSTSMVNPTTLTSVYESELYKVDNIVDYFSNNCNTGILVTGDTRCMKQLEECILYNLSGDCDVYSACTLDSDWLHKKFTITDEETLESILNQKVKLGFIVKDCDCDFSLLIDNIEINKVCTTTDKEDIYITKCPSFEIERVCDNKKSWVTEETKQNRDFTFPTRETDYDINHHKLAINTKEIDLDISPANAIETDVWCYIKDNEEILDCSTGTTSITCSTEYDFGQILSAQTNICDSSFNSGCTITTNWGIDVTLDCKTIYNNKMFYSGTTMTDVPTKSDYILELSGIATTLGLEFTTGTTSVILTDYVDCTNSRFINNNFKVDLTLDIITNCTGTTSTKQFQNLDNFEFQDNTDFDFN